MQFFIWNSARAYDVSAPVFDTRELLGGLILEYTMRCADAGEYAEFLLMENLCPEFLRDVARDVLSCGLYVRMLKRCGMD